MSNKSLKGKTALVTGSSRGIGLAIAQAYVEAGAEVWFHGRCKMDAALTGETEGRAIYADLADEKGVASLVTAMCNAAGRLDILVNNAGIEEAIGFEDLSVDILERTWAVNAYAPVRLIQGLLPLLKESGCASVINVTSIHASTPYAGNVAYCMSKAALDMATKVAAIELAPFGIRVNNLAPGAIETDINRDVLDEIGRDKFAEWIPLGRVGSIDEVCGPAIFLASDDASYVTGITLCADGGYNLNLVRYRADAAD